MPTDDSLWSHTSRSEAFPRLTADTEVDVLVAGGGITGLTAAHALALDGKRVMIVEARRIGMGVSHRSTAHLTEAIDTRYQQIAATFGREGARLVAESSRGAIETVASLARSIGCDFLRRPGFLYTENDQGVAELQKELVAAVDAGLPVELLSFAPVAFMTRAALRFPDQAHLPPQSIHQLRARRSHRDRCSWAEGDGR